MKFKLTPALKIAILLLVACLAYLWVTVYFEGAGTPVPAATTYQVSSMSLAKDLQIPNSAGTLPGVNAQLKGSCVDISKDNKLIKPPKNEFGQHTPTADNKFMCGVKKPFTLPNSSSAAELPCTLYRGETIKGKTTNAPTFTNFKGICSDGNTTSPKYFYVTS